MHVCVHVCVCVPTHVCMLGSLGRVSNTCEEDISLAS